MSLSFLRERTFTAGFTLLEVLMIILIIGILSAVALPRFVDLREQARLSAEAAIIGGVREGIHTYFTNSLLKGRTPLYPAALDNAVNTQASGGNPFFGEVLVPPGISEPGWAKASGTLYRTPSGYFYVYDPSSGTFAQATGGKEIASTGEVYTYVPAQSANPWNTSVWSASDGGVYSPWANDPLDFTFDFTEGGTFSVEIGVVNNANHPDFTAQLGQAERTDWHLPSGYTDFLVDVYVDGVQVSPPGFSIAASDTVVNSASLSTSLAAGPHTLRLIWRNDQWTPWENGDANIQYQSISIHSTN